MALLYNSKHPYVDGRPGATIPGRTSGWGGLVVLARQLPQCCKNISGGEDMSGPGGHVAMLDNPGVNRVVRAVSIIACSNDQLS